MRISFVLAFAIAGPAMFVVTACGGEGAAPATKSKPLKGTVTEREYEPAVRETRQVPVTKRVCTKPRKGKEKCSRIETGRTKVQKVVVKKACFELEITTEEGLSYDICDQAAYKALDIKDRYNSKIDYSKDGNW